jgi:hypothetical protein
MAACARLGAPGAGLCWAGLPVVVCAEVLARADVLARAAVLALATVAVATVALSAVQAAMRPAATTRLPRIMVVTRRE